jgi:(2Fe-2S) ferredoxin
LTPRRYKIIVCRGPECGERLGSSAIHAAFIDAIRLRRIESVAELGWQSCFGRCRLGANVLVQLVTPGETRFLLAAPPTSGLGAAFYSGVTPADALRIVDEHVIGGRPLRLLIRRPEDALKR